jgi:Ca2+-binding RTX toxin-like protein
MNNIKTWYEFVLAQMASDSYLDDPSESDPRAEPFDFKLEADLQIRLRNGANHYNHVERQERDGRPLSATRMTTRMAQDFVEIWEVIDHVSNTTSGFSATVLKHKVTGTYTLSFRSTESKNAIDGGDVERDSFNGANGQIGSLGFAWGQLRDMENYYRRLKSGTLATGNADDGEALATALAGGRINITGYSLGSHLAQVFTLLHPDAVAHAYTFNGAGIGTIANLDPLTEYGPAILERIDTLNAVMADPSGYVDRFDGEALVSIADALTGGTFVDVVAGSPFTVAMLEYVAALRNALFAESPSERVYDDPFFKLALSVLPDDTTGASAVGILESVNYTRDRITPHDRITNLYGHSFSGERVLDEVTAGAGQLFGSYLPIYIEDQPLLATDVDLLPPSFDAILRSFGPTHSIALVADSLAVMDLYAAIDPSLVSDGPSATPPMRLNRLFESMTNTRARLLVSPKGEGNTLEVALDSLGHLVLGAAWQPTAWNAAPGAYADLEARDAFYAQVERLRDALFQDAALKPAYAGLKILSLAEFDAATLAARAQTEVAYRYALRRLNPFVISGNDAIYAQHEPDGHAESGVVEAGQYSAAYWFDRAIFLLGLADANTHSRATPDGEAVVLSGADLDYLDVTSGKVLHEASPLRITVQRANADLVLHDDTADRVARVTFSDGATVAGSSRPDRLYGAHAANTLIGKRGDDRLEGGDGDDTLYGNAPGHGDDDVVDLLYGGRGADTYYANFRDVIDDLDGIGTVVLGDHRLAAGYRELRNAAHTYTSEDGRYTYRHDPAARTLTVTAGNSDPFVALTIVNFSNGDLGISLHENPQPTAARFFGSAAHDTISVNAAGTEISGTIDARVIEPVARFTPLVQAIAARGGDDVVTVAGDVPGIRIYGDTLAGETAADGHDEIIVDSAGFTGAPGSIELDNGARIFGGGGNDRLEGGRRSDELFGGSGNDWISGGNGNDRISGGEDDPAAPATDNDVLIGGAGRDDIFGHGGDDALFGGQGGDTLKGGAGNDAIYGDLISWAYAVADPAVWSGPSLTRGSDGIYSATAGAGAVLATPHSAGEHFVFAAAIDAEAGADDLDGGAGDDHLLGGSGNDRLAGGADRDLLEGEAGDDTLFGDGGNDTLYGDISPSTYAKHSAPVSTGTAPDGSWVLSFREFLHGPDAGGDDVLDGGAGTDTLIGGVGDDVLDGGRFDHAIDVLYGGTGNDTYVFGFGDGRTFVYDAGGDADRIVFRAGVMPEDVHLKADTTGSNLIIALTLNGVDIGDELVISNWYRSHSIETFTFDAGPGWTTAFVAAATGLPVDNAEPVDNGGVILAATDAADVSFGGSDNDEVYLLAGADLFAGGSGDDRIFGGGGNDELQGNDGNDVIAGEAGHDLLYAQAGNDALYGGNGDDTLSGGDGDDTLFGGAGNDDLIGGPGDDSYVYERGDGEDVIRDDGGAADRIVFARSIAPADVTVDSSGNTLIFDVRSNRARVGDRLAIVDGLLATSEIESVEFADGTVWNSADIVARLPDSYALTNGLVVTGGANGTTYTLATALDDGFTIEITDTGGIDVVDLRTAIAGSGALVPILTGSARNGDDLLLAVTLDSTLGSIADARGAIRINGYYSEDGYIETIRFGTSTLNALNVAPRVTNPPADQVIPLNVNYSYIVPAAIFDDSPFDRIALSAMSGDGSELPDWLAFDSASGAFAGTPASGDAEILDVVLVATDAGGLSAGTRFELNVGNVNVAPVARAPITPQSAIEGTAFALTPAADTFTDPNPDDILTLSAHLAGGEPLPAWLSFNAHTNTFSGTPGAADTGLLLLELTATDTGALGVTTYFILNVDYLNDAPRLVIEPANVAVTEHSRFSFRLPAGTFVDDDVSHGDGLTYALSMQDATPLPGWLLFDAATLTFSGRPVGIFADQDFALRLSVTDKRGATATADFSLHVTDAATANAWYVPHAPDEIGAPAYSRNRSVTTALHNGDYVVVWESAGRDGDAGGIYAQRYRAAGTAVGSTVQVNTTTLGDQRSLAVGALTGGGFVVSWVSLHEDDGNQVPPLHDGGGVYAQLFAADARPIGGETRVNHVWSGIQDQTAIAPLGDGGYMITWFSQFEEQRINVVEYGVGEPGLFGQRYAASGAPVSAAVRLADVGITNLEPSAAGLIGGGFVIAWNAPDGDDTGIVAQRYASNGTQHGPGIRVNSWAADRQSTPRLAALATGGFVVVWCSDDQDASGGGVFGQRFAPNGAPIGDEFRVNSTTFGTQGEPAVAATPDGGFVVSWLSAPISGIGDLYMQRYGADGVKVGTETLVDAAGFQNDAPSLTVLPDGSIVHTWTATDSGGLSTDPAAPWTLAQPTRIESKRIELRANTPVEARQSTVALAAAEFKSVVYRIQDNVFFDPDLAYGDALEFRLQPAPDNILPSWLAFDPATATFNGLPLAGDTGTWDIAVTAMDRAGTVAEANFVLGVTKAADITITAAPTSYRVNSTEPRGNFHPAATRLSDGSRIIVWDSGAAIHGQRYAADGAVLGAEFRLDGGITDSSRPAVAAVDDGGFVAVWERADGQLLARIYDSAGMPRGGAFPVGAQSPGDKRGARAINLGHGEFAVAWQTDGTGSTATITLQRYSSAAVPIAIGAAVDIVAEVPGNPGFSLASCDSGEFIVAWTGINAAGGESVFARRFSAAGAPVGEPIRVDDNTAFDHRDPALASLAGGGFVLTWTADLRDGDEDVYARLLDESGSPRGAAWRVNNLTELPQRNADVTATDDGGFVIAWHSEPGIHPAEYGSVRAQYFDRAGNPVRDEIPVTLESRERASRPVIVTDLDGGFDVYWESDHEDNGAAADAILARHFAVGGSAFNAAPVVVAPLADHVLLEGADYSFFVPGPTFIDPEREALSYRATLAGGAALPSWLAFDPHTRHLSGHPGNDDIGVYDITVTATDPSGISAADRFRLTVNNVNEAPTAVDDIAGLRFDTGTSAIVVDVLANDWDPDAGDNPANFTLDTVTLASGPGSVGIVGNKLHYAAGTDFVIPAGGGIAEAIVTYTMSDSDGASAVGTATIGLHNGNVELLGGEVVNVSGPSDLYGYGTFILGPGASGSRVTLAASAAGNAFGASRRSTVQIAPGSGSTTIGRALGGGLAGSATLQFTGLSRRELQLGIGSLRLTFAGTDVELHIDEFDPDDVFGATPVIDTFVFDGIAYTYGELLRQGFDIEGSVAADLLTGTNVVDRISGFDGNDTIVAGDGSDLLRGGTGDDVLNGGRGDDTYVFSRGDGHDVITDPRGSDRVVFAAGLSSADARSERRGDDLYLAVSRGDSISVRNWFAHPDNRIEAFAFTDDDLRFVDAATAETIDHDHAPVVATPIPDQQASVGSDFSYRIPGSTFTDVDRDKSLTLSATRADGSPIPAWLHFDAEDWRLHGQPPGAAAGVVSIRITATDPTGLAATDDFTLALARPPGNAAPQVASAIVDYTVITGHVLDFMLHTDTFVDPDPGDSLNLSAQLADGTPLPAWLVFDPVTRTFSGTAPAAAGSVTVEVVAEDQSGLRARDSFDLWLVPEMRMICGSRRADTLRGSNGPDRISGYAGDDVIDGLFGDDEITGGAGKDMIIDLSGDNTVYGDAHDDLITTGAGADVIHGGSHADTIDAGDGNNRVSGGNGSDVITAGGGADWITGGGGNDVINPGAGRDIVFGGRGEDVVVALVGDKFVDGGPHADTITTGAGDDTIFGGSHHDVIDAGAGNDTLYGGNGDDRLVAGAGADWIDGGGGADSIYGGAGNDTLVGHTGGDTYFFARHDGVDVVVETTSQRNDTIAFGADIAADQLWFSGAGDDLRIDLLGTPDTVFVRDWYTRRGTIERFELAGGAFLADAAVAQLVEAMAAFNPPAGTETTLPGHIAQSVDPVIAAVWQSAA